MSANPMSYNNKDLVLDVVRTERRNFYDIIDDPDNWRVQTRAELWEVRDMAGHMVDVNEGYLERWEIARQGEEFPAPLGTTVMAERLNEAAQSLRSVPREEVIERLKTSAAELDDIFEDLTEEEWSEFLVPHVFMGPLPTFFYPAFQIMDYGVHSWDMRWGLGEKDASLDERTAGVLVPYMLILMQSTVDQESAAGLDAVYGIVVDGAWGGTWKATVSDGEFSYEPTEDLNDVQAIYHYANASDFVLTTFQRTKAAEASGDQEVIAGVDNLFFTI
jgi:uncharacterized protein (TIGR03083 family)